MLSDHVRGLKWVLSWRKWIYRGVTGNLCLSLMAFPTYNYFKRSHNAALVHDMLL